MSYEEGYEPIEIFKPRKGLNISLDTNDNGEHQWILVNFDTDEAPGGYISIKLTEEGVCLDAINAGNVIGSMWFFYEDFAPEEDNECNE